MSQSLQSFGEEFYAIGTTWHIDITHTDSNTALGVFSELRSRIELFEKTYSRFRTDSLIYEMSQHAGVYPLPTDAIPMFDLYKKMYNLSKGLMTPLIGQMLHDTGYDATYSLIPKPIIRQVPTWDSALKYNPQTKTLTVYTPVQLDLGAIGKGYIIDIVRNICKEKHIQTYTIDAGRDIYHYGNKETPLSIGLENPFDTTQAIGTAHITQGAICGTSGNRRAWNTYTHILNPETQTSPRDISAVWITAEDAMIADALTTAIFFTPIDILQKHFSFEYILVYSDGSAMISNNFPGELF